MKRSLLGKVRWELILISIFLLNVIINNVQKIDINYWEMTELHASIFHELYFAYNYLIYLYVCLKNFLRKFVKFIWSWKNEFIKYNLVDSIIFLCIFVYCKLNYIKISLNSLFSSFLHSFQSKKRGKNRKYLIIPENIIYSTIENKTNSSIFTIQIFWSQYNKFSHKKKICADVTFLF